MIAPDLLEILCCPETHQTLAPVDDATVAALNSRIAGGQVKNRAGKPVTEPVEGALRREDGQYLYLIRRKIPIMLIDEAVPALF